MITERLKQAEIQQNKAVDGHASVWVSASAGTGKTYVLTKRILHLLLTDFSLKPSQILAVTFTRAAAREMENRILSLLQKWQQMSEEDLHLDLQKTLGQTPLTKAHIQRAKDLFSLVLDDMVHTNTIHGFCQHILGRFPIEAGLAPSTRVLDDIEAKQLLAQVKQEVLQKGFAGEIEPQWAILYLAQNFGEQTLLRYLGRFVTEASRFKRLMDKHQGSLDHTLKVLAHVLQVPEGLTPETETVGYDDFLEAVQHFLPHISQIKSKTAEKVTAHIQCYLKDAYTDETKAEHLMRIFMTAKKVPKKASGTGGIGIPKKEWEARNIATQVYETVQATLGRLLDQQKSRRTYLSSAAVLYIGAHVLRAYTAEKRAQNVLDFDDLIHYTSALLKKEDVQAWVRFKLDLQLKHVLLDEAQDTDRMQWHILRTFVDEFYAGEGQHVHPRTFFSVGDMKQSIYRFRGAEPFVFDDMRTYLKHHEKRAHYPVAEAHLETSFRSSDVVLDFVDCVFASKERKEAVDTVVEHIQHYSVHENVGGHVELWSLIESHTEKEEEESWTVPEKLPVDTHARRQVADKVAQSILTLLNDKTPLYTTKRPAQPEDIMILLQKRTFLTALISALDAHKIPHTGADVIDLNASPLVEDCLQLMRLSLMPEDAFARAQVFKSPLLGWSDDQLYAARFKKQLPEQLSSFLKQVQSASVYRFLILADQVFSLKQRYSYIYDPQQIETTFDALLDQALAWQNPEGIAGFIQQMTTVQQKVKRQLSAVKGKVRILTAHGSKGLEAPVVYMPDAGLDMYADLAKEDFLWHTTEDNEDLAFMVRLPTSAGDACQKQCALAELEKERVFKDKMRLLYVALTRAKDRLYIGGEGKGGVSTWHGQLNDALEQRKDARYIQEPQGTWVRHDPVSIHTQKTAESVQETIGACPAYFKEKVTYKNQLQYLKASMSSTPKKLTLYDKKEKHMGFVYGETVHKLLEILPHYTASKRLEAGALYLKQKPLPLMQKEAALQKALSIITALPELFDPKKSQGEVPVMCIKEGKHFEGIIDRVVVHQDSVWIVDYKTDQKIQQEGIPQAYQTQLGLYKWAIQDVYPEKEVKAGILWVNAKTPKIEWLQ